MLKRVSFKNFKSFVDLTTIDLEETKSEILEDSNVYNGILKGCAFYGANASGKTNALLSITFLLDLLFKESDIDTRILVSRYSKKENMFFEYTFEFPVLFFAGCPLLVSRLAFS